MRSSEPPPRILHVGHGFLPDAVGGTEIQLDRLARAQQARGHEVLVLARQGGSSRPDFTMKREGWRGLDVVRLSYDFGDFDRFDRLYTHPTLDARFAELLADWRPDLVHFHHFTGLSTSMVEVAKQKDLPVVAWLSDFWLQCPRGQRFHPRERSICATLDRARCVGCLESLWPHLISDEPASPPGSAGPDRASSRRELEAWERHVRRILALCDATLYPSRSHRDRFTELAPVAKAHVVPYGLPVEELAAAPRGRRPIRHLGFVGTVIPSKGVHVLVEAFNRLARADLTLHIHGEAVPFFEQTDYDEELRGMVDPGLSVVFHGRYEPRELPAILASLDLLVVPSIWWESFCLTAREGALAGLPVVAADLAGLGEAVAEGLALGFEPGDAASLATVVTRLLEEPSLCDAISRRGHRVTSVDEWTDQIAGIYRQVLEG